MSKKEVMNRTVKAVELGRISLQPVGIIQRKSLGPKSCGAYKIRKIEQTKFRYFCKLQAPERNNRADTSVCR